MLIEGEDEPRYVTLADLREALSAEPEMLGMLDAAQPAHDSYDPQTEALVMVCSAKAIHVVLVGGAGIRVLGQIDFIPTVC